MYTFKEWFGAGQDPLKLKQIKPFFPISIRFQVSIFGIYHLTEVDAHFKEYLLAMDIPHTAAEIITKM